MIRCLGSQRRRKGSGALGEEKKTNIFFSDKIARELGGRRRRRLAMESPQYRGDKTLFPFSLQVLGWELIFILERNIL